VAKLGYDMTTLTTNHLSDDQCSILWVKRH